VSTFRHLRAETNPVFKTCRAQNTTRNPVTLDANCKSPNKVILSSLLTSSCLNQTFTDNFFANFLTQLTLKETQILIER